MAESIHSTGLAQQKNETIKVEVNPSVEIPWHAAYPAPNVVAPSLSRQELLGWFCKGKSVGRDFVLVDLRRTDFEVRSSPIIFF
jgi:hypothetical protein